ncbi:MAG: GNAT family N-acetyltransferase [Clostridiales bacterium]|nr:GNAT family N-acetyltransferase [Clostridiales bacterium]
MLRLRPYKSCDAEIIARWIRDRDVFLKWGGELFGAFPIGAETIDEMYRVKNGNCSEPDNFYPWVALDEENRLVGHFIMRYMHGDHRVIRFGWVVVDNSARGKGTGTEMLRAGLKFAFEMLGADRVTIGVFENNDPAHRCYRKVGFADREVVQKDPWNVIEMEIRKTDYRVSG